MKVLLLGGSKSGKSMFAQRLIRTLAERDGSKPYYWATMEPSDAEDISRIERHIEERRGLGFETIECAKSIATHLQTLDRRAAVLFDSITALTANEMFGTPKSGYFKMPDISALKRTEAELHALLSIVEHTVLVCDEIFRDGKNYDTTTEEYRRSLAHICRTMAQSCDAVAEVTAGQVKLHKGELPCF